MKAALVAACGLAVLFARGTIAAGPPLDLRGYMDRSGAIAVHHGGQSVDPYFALQALLLAHENGMNTASSAERFVEWLLPRQKPDGTFDRFCKAAGPKWVACNHADADDSLLAMWSRLLETMPTLLENNPAWKRSHARSVAALNHLFQPSRGVYMVSPVYLHGLFMDNLEVWSYKANSTRPERLEEAGTLARAIHDTFWEGVDKRFLVSTQLEQRAVKPAFYPDHVAQIFPLLVDFPLLPAEPGAYYRKWMQEHRGAWLAQGEKDYPWGLIAVLALRQNDRVTASCWMLEARLRRHSARWAVTDESSYQILLSKGLTPAPSKANCHDNPRP